MVKDKLNEKKILASFWIKPNLWTFHASNDLFWNFYMNLEFVKVRKVHPEATFLYRQF